MRDEYKIISSRNVDNLVAQVNHALAGGFELAGGLSVDSGGGATEFIKFHQALILKAKKARKKAVPKSFDAPTGVDPKIWADYIQHRKEKGKAMTKTAYTRLCNSLEKITGEEANAALVASIKNSWTGVFPKTKKMATGAEPLQYILDTELEAWARRKGAPAPKNQVGYDYSRYRADLEAWLAKQ